MSTFDETKVKRAGDGTFAEKPAAPEAGCELDGLADPAAEAVNAERAVRSGSVAAYDEHLAGLREQMARAEQERGRHVLADLALRHPDAISVHVIDGRGPRWNPEGRSGIDMVSVRRPDGREQADFALGADGWNAVNVPNGPDDVWRGFDADGQKAPAARTLDLDKVRAWSAGQPQVSADTIAEAKRLSEERAAVANHLSAIGDAVRRRDPDARYVDLAVRQTRSRRTGDSTTRVSYRSTVSDAGVTLYDATVSPADPDAADRHWEHVDKVEAAVAHLDRADEATWLRAAAPRQGGGGYAGRDERTRQIERDAEGRLTSVRIDLDADIRQDG